MYRTAAICEQGHVLSAMYEAGSLPPKHCPKHGTKVYMACTYCHARIQGAPYGAVSAPGYRAPRFCPECAKPYPWTFTQLERAQSEIDRHLLKSGVSSNDADSIKAFATGLAAGTATREQATGIRSVLQSLGPVGSVIWDQVKDFGARVLADMAKP